ncbi:MAG: hypothetical protein ACFFCS_04295, partial [Candidatus Hodarchaeota archaeon]
SVMKFTGTDIEVYFELKTGIMVYYEWFSGVNASHRITFGLMDNNQTYPINLQMDKRLEIVDEGTTIIPNHIFEIIYDPPGDHSYSQVSAGTTATYEYSFTTVESFETFFQMELLVMGFGAGVDMNAEVLSSTANSFEVEYAYEKTLTSSLDSEDPALIGPGRGDLYYGAGVVLHYYIMSNNYYIVVNEPDMPNNNTDDIKVWENGSHIAYDFNLSSQFSVLGAYLDQYNISQLAAENIFADNYISPSEAEFVEEVPDSPLFWTPGYISELLYSQTSTATRSYSFTLDMSLEAYLCWNQAISVSVGAGAFVTVSVGKTVFETTGKIGVGFGFSSTLTSTSATQQNREIICHLEDDDGTPVGLNDQFQVGIYKDMRYNTFGYIVYENNTYTSGPFEVGTRERRPPSVCELYDLDGFVHGNVSISCIAVDDETSINNTKFYYDDDPFFDIDSTFIGIQTVPTGLDSNIYQVTWDTSLMHGTYYLFAVAWDNAPVWLNSRSSDPLLVQIDNVLPASCEMVAYSPFSGPISLYATAFDADSGIDYIEYWDGDPALPGSTLLGTSVDSSNAYLFTWATDPGGSDDGSHSLHAVAFDRAGNSLASRAFVISVDNAEGVGIDTGEGIVIGSVIIAAGILGAGILSRLLPKGAKPVIKEKGRSFPEKSTTGYK